MWSLVCPERMVFDASVPSTSFDAEIAESFASTANAIEVFDTAAGSVAGDMSSVFVSNTRTYLPMSLDPDATRYAAYMNVRLPAPPTESCPTARSMFVPAHAVGLFMEYLNSIEYGCPALNHAMLSV